MKVSESDLQILKTIYRYLEENGYQPDAQTVGKLVNQRTQSVQAALRRLEDDGFISPNGGCGGYKLNAVYIKVFHESHREAVEAFFKTLP